jgi:hypothetical protein
MHVNELNSEQFGHQNKEAQDKREEKATYFLAM